VTFNGETPAHVLWLCQTPPHEEGVAEPAAAPSKQFLMHLMIRIFHCQNKTRIGML